jgi:hypothetical protein
MKLTGPPLIEFCANGKAGNRIPFTKTSVALTGSPFNPTDVEPGEKLFPVVWSGLNIPTFSGNLLSTSLTV